MKNLFLFFVLVIFVNSTFSQESKILKGHTEDINALAFSIDGKYLYSGGDDEKLICWDMGTMKILKTININDNIFKIIPLRNGNELFIVHGTNDGRITTIKPFGYLKSNGFVNINDKILFDKSRGLNDLGSGPMNIDYSFDNDIFYTVNNIGSANQYAGDILVHYNENIYLNLYSSIGTCNYNEKLIDFNRIDEVSSTDKKKKSESWEFNYSQPMSISPDGKYFTLAHYIDKSYISTYKDKNGYKYTETHYKTLTQIKVFFFNNSKTELFYTKTIPSTDYNHPEILLKLDANGNNIYYVNKSDDKIVIRNGLRTKYEYQYKGHDKRILCMEMHPTDLFLATGSKDNTVILWDIKKNKMLKKFIGHEDNVRSIAFSRDGRYMATGSDDNTIRVWDISNLTPEIKEFSLKYDKESGIQTKYFQEMKEELKTIESKFAPKREFETTEEYNKRIEDANAEKKAIEEKYNQKISEDLKSKESEYQSTVSENQNEVQRKIEASVRDTTLKIQKIGSYDADNQTFSITINFMTENINIPREDALDFKKNYEKAKVKSKKKLKSDLMSWEYYDIIIINPSNNKEYIFK